MKLLIIVLLTTTIFAKEYIPSHKTIRNYEGFSLEYDEEFELARWVAYELTSKEVRGKYKRKDNFRADPQILTKTAKKSDYRNSGYDRGHLIPAADQKWSKKAMSESFFMSNMSPQKPGFNRGVWKNLEEQIRDWAKEYNSIWVITGPILEPNLKRIGKSKVAVPNKFYKIVVDNNSKPKKAIAFIFENKATKKPISSFSTTIDSIEILTGIDFFEKLDDIEEHKLESYSNSDLWSWNSSKEISKISTSSGNNSKSIEKKEEKKHNFFIQFLLNIWHWIMGLIFTGIAKSA